MHSFIFSGAKHNVHMDQCLHKYSFSEYGLATASLWETLAGLWRSQVV